MISDMDIPGFVTAIVEGLVGLFVLLGVACLLRAGFKALRTWWKRDLRQRRG
jgi:hypothetical protein